MTFGIRILVNPRISGLQNSKVFRLQTLSRRVQQQYMRIIKYNNIDAIADNESSEKCANIHAGQDGRLK